MRDPLEIDEKDIPYLILVAVLALSVVVYVIIDYYNKQPLQ